MLKFQRPSETAEKLESLRETANQIVSVPVIKKPKGTFYVVDCETDPFHHCSDLACPKCHGIGRVPQPFIWGVYEGKSDEYLEFATAAEFVAWASQINATFYAHNGGKFDYHYLRPWINTDESPLLINGRLAKFRIGAAEFRDSLNIFPNTRLKDFDDAHGAKIEIDYAIMEPEARTDPNNAAEISRYLKRDCVQLWEKVRRYWDDYGKSLTQAGSSMKYWSKMYDIEPPRQTKAQFDRYRQYYFGGRVQCFESGVQSGDFGVWDINSAYPYAMLDEHPISPHAVRQHSLPANDAEFNTALIDLHCVAKGCFPWRDPDNNKTYFPEDERRSRRYWVTGWELRAAIELNAVQKIKINNVHVFPKRTSFKHYIEHFFNLREEARKNQDVAGRIFGKYFMNSLYGKFGANCENYSEYMLADAERISEYESQGYKIYQDWGNSRFLLARNPSEDTLNDATQKRWRYYNVATAASITGYVRAYLFKAMSRCSGLIYCDTDSIAARHAQGLNLGTALGAFKHEGDFDRFAIAGKKLYAFHTAGAGEEYAAEGDASENWKIASKGARLTPAEIIRIAMGEKITYRPEVPTYSVTRQVPTFINRTVVNTYSDMRQAPDKVHPHNKNLDPIIVTI